LSNVSMGFAGGLLVSECTRGAGTLLAAWVMSRLEERKLSEYGLPWRSGETKRFALGAFFGIVEISVVIGVLAALGYYRFGSIEIHGTEFVKWLIFWAVTFLAVGFFEEFAFRGYARFALERGFGFWPAAATTSLLFGAVHVFNPGESWPGIAGVVLVGFFWCFTVRRTGTLWFALGMHAAFDFGETFVFSVPDSGAVFPGHLSSAVIRGGPAWLVGGTAGPEASVLDFLMLAIFFYVVHRMYPAKPETPDHAGAESTSTVASFSSTNTHDPRNTLDSSIH
jgi:membrane protease YdiL (CAAX protease family)